MEASIAQFAEIIESAKNILVITKVNASSDEIEAALVLHEALTAYQKPNTICIPEFDAMLYPEAATKGAVAALTRMRQFMVTIDLEKVELEANSQEIRDKKFRVRLSPKEGLWSKADVQVGHSDWRFDLCITVGVEKPEDIGKQYQMYKEFFDDIQNIKLQGTPESILDLVELL